MLKLGTLEEVQEHFREAPEAIKAVTAIGLVRAKVFAVQESLAESLIAASHLAEDEQQKIADAVTTPYLVGRRTKGKKSGGEPDEVCWDAALFGFDSAGALRYELAALQGPTSRPLDVSYREFLHK